jgi:hypothetical protein
MTESDSPQPKTFAVLDGGWVMAPDWLNFPQTVRARSPDNRSLPCRIRISRGDTYKAADARRRQPAHELWSIVIGKVPPVPNLPNGNGDGLISLFDAHACFKGIQRPLAEDPSGGNWIAYVSKPKFFFTFEPRPPGVFTEKRPVPSDLVFVAYVKLDEASDGLGATKGVLTHWHFVECDKSDPMLPLDFARRYAQRLW